MLTILIVDDESLERNGIKFLLKREEQDFRILEAGMAVKRFAYFWKNMWIFCSQM